MEMSPLEVLLVEDNPGDVLLLQRELKHCKIVNNMNVVTDGISAMQYLHKQGRYRNAVRPDLILLDLNLPNMDGRKVLAAIKTDPELGSIPVAVLTSSDAESDIAKSYDLHCSCYLVKPLNLEQFQRLARGVEDFWFSLVKLPPRKAS
jgi:two-component system, chemotaxis family, response regulator Rcp1